ncbi:hypothetical protein GpartN1_g384.t1 [Galdieria partita]|uniref:GPI inositol-deacylase n=1 Tax=Galdieria partita TaxID=83374 RepID=A0A9C7PQ92_9RHOD|nr:hypothetical protein GpartN1_g384.t1 [Galdieria partita]
MMWIVAIPRVNRKRDIQYPRCCHSRNNCQNTKQWFTTPVVIVPGYGADAKEYTGLKTSLEYFGWKCFIVPIQWHHWIPTIGGRPVTPILEILSTTVQQVLNDTQTDKVHLVAHSAAGWICRIWLGSGVYCGASYDCQKWVSSLVCLGTPHRSKQKLTKTNLDYVNQQFPDAFHSHIQYVCVAGTGCKNPQWWKPKEWTAYISYQMTLGTHLCEGDGIIPVPCATLKDAWNILLDGVWHSPRSPGLWYGHPTVVSQWQHCLQTVNNFKS